MERCEVDRRTERGRYGSIGAFSGIVVPSKGSSFSASIMSSSCFRP